MGKALRGFALEGAEDILVLALPKVSASRGLLSTAESAVAELVVAGLSNAEIGERRGTSVCTVAAQLASIYRKTGVSSRAELAYALTRSGK